MVHKARFFDRRPKTIEDAQKRAERMAKHFSIEVDATSEQTDKLVELARGAAGDVFPIRRSTKEVRKEGIEILSAETVDRARLEEIRTEQFAKFETISKRLTTALADAAEVLNPEQRKALAERVKEWRGWRGGRGWRGHGPGKHRPWHD
jgi:Spy/CpxP family protein refolding chaperone